MNMKTLIWAGLGLFISMTITTIWISRDLKTIRAENRQRHLAECADAQAGGSTASAAATTGVAPAVDPLASPGSTSSAVQPATGQPTAKACAPQSASTTATPATGSTDPYAASQSNQGQSSQYQDPNAGYAVSAAQPDQYGGTQQQYQAPAQPQAGTAAPAYAPTDVGGAAS